MNGKTEEEIVNARNMKLNIYHHMQGSANQYFICYGNMVYFQIPNFIGKLLTKR